MAGYSGGRGRRRARILIALGFLVIIAGTIGSRVASEPWAYHIGDRSTPGRSWQGWGTVAATNGGQYVLFVNIKADTLWVDEDNLAGCVQPGCTEVRGDAKICTLSGASIPLQADGDVHAWWSADGAHTSLVLSVRNPDGSTVVSVMDGKWQGPALVLADSSDFTAAFTKDGAIRPDRSTENDGTARVTLRYGAEPEYDAACDALTTT
jgi:hypothetical protein